jgi:hypothetical protein
LAIQFLEKNLHNASEKLPLLRRHAPTHAIAYAQPARGVALELTQHGPLVAAPSAFKVLLQGDAPTSTGAQDEGWDSCFGARGVWLDEFQAPAWFASGGADWSVQRIGVNVRDEAQAHTFWTKGLGARPTNVANATGCVAFVSPVPRWSLTVQLRPANATPRPMLDDSGFPCLALLTTNLEQDVKRACEHGGHSPTAPFVLTVNHRPLKVGLLRGPSDELIELIEIQRS